VFFKVFVPRKSDCLVCQTGTSGFDHLVLKCILCEYTFSGSPSCYYILLYFIKYLEEFLSRFVHIFLIKLKCLVCQTGVSNFHSLILLHVLFKF
jgi:hypothetical protein